MRIETAVNIQCSPEEAFIYLIDPDKLKQWQSGLVESRKLTEGEIGVGTTFENVLGEIAGQRITLLGKVTTFTPNEDLTLQATSDQIVLTISYRISELASGIQLQQIGDFDFQGFFYKTISSFLQGFLRQRAVEDLDRLKVLLESE